MNKKVHILFFTLACMASSAALAMKESEKGKTKEKTSHKRKFFLLCITNPNFINIMEASRNKTVKKHKRDLVGRHGITSLDNFDRDAEELQKLNDAISQLNGKIKEKTVEGIFQLEVKPPQAEKAVRNRLMKSSYYVSKVVAGKKKRKSYLTKRMNDLNLLS